MGWGMLQVGLNVVRGCYGCRVWRDLLSNDGCYGCYQNYAEYRGDTTNPSDDDDVDDVE